MANLPVKDDSGPGVLTMVVGGVIGAVVLFWLAGIVISTVVFALRVVIVLAVVAGAIWLWNKVKGG